MTGGEAIQVPGRVDVAPRLLWMDGKGMDMGWESGQFFERVFIEAQSLEQGYFWELF